MKERIIRGVRVTRRKPSRSPEDWRRIAQDWLNKPLDERYPHGHPPAVGPRRHGDSRCAAKAQAIVEKAKADKLRDGWAN